MTSDLLSLVRALVPAARAAGAVELGYFRAGRGTDPGDVIAKTDGSPVTRADREAEELITAALRDIAPGVPVVGEEEASAGRVPDVSGGTFFLVDPLDGTREFISGGGDFTVNIALLVGFRPVMGLIYAPASDDLFLAGGGSGFRVLAGGAEERLRVRRPPAAGLTVVASRSHGDPARLAPLLRGHAVARTVRRSSSLKFCVLAAGEADFYPRPAPTFEWDTAAGEAILDSAGGRVETLTGGPMIYGKKDAGFLNPHFVAWAAAPAPASEMRESLCK